MLWSAEAASHQPQSQGGQAGPLCSHSGETTQGTLRRAAPLHRQQGTAGAAHVCPARLSLLDLKVEGCQPSSGPTVL